MTGLWSKIDRVQKSRGFKYIATVLLAVLALVAGVTYVVRSNTDRASDQVQFFDASRIEDPAMRAQVERQQRAIQQILAQDRSPLAVGLGIAVGLGMSLAIVWLGLSLTYLLLGLAVTLVAGPMMLLSYYGRAGPTLGEFGRILSGAALLTMFFTAGLEVMRLALSVSTGPVCAVARNVLAEAVRMKVSLLLIVLLIFGLAAVPMLLNEGTPLRYRMQSFLQYGTGGAFWMIAVLTLLLSAASLTVEQRDKIIWQTMTKPVPAWKYLLGKWLGVMSLNAVLLVVCGSAIFLFAEYLRQQPAKGESVAYVSSGVRFGDSVLSEDRRILHNQVLRARVARDIDLPLAKNSPEFAQIVDQYIQQRDQLDEIERLEQGPRTRTQIRDDLYKDLVQRFRTIDPGQGMAYTFSGLHRAARQDSPLLLRYRIESGANMPDEFFRLVFRAGNYLVEREVGLAQTLIIDDIPPSAINEDGVLELEIINGSLVRGSSGQIGVVPNPRSIRFPAGGLELSYSVGSYQMNFLRVMVVLWIKLAFLSLLAIAASTALSFPVACLVAFGAFFAAESALFLEESLEVYNPFFGEGIGPVLSAVVGTISRGVIWLFRVYADLNPTQKLVAGEYVSWTSLGQGIVVLGVWCAVLFGLAWLVFRSRELAIYSGQ
ncbi:MAG: hypothetical protein KIT54_02170 [Phycisphaeraceae bacterium]|nr:hypothetical protein [Phycisphaeraceae bacterium]